MKFLAVAGTWLGLMIVAVAMGMGAGLLVYWGGGPLVGVSLVSFVVAMPFGLVATLTAMRMADRCWP